MIGVLAVIGILAGMLLPRILSAISTARVTAAALAYNAVKNASLTYLGKYGKFAGTNGSALTLGAGAATNWDSQVLMYEGLLEKPLGAPIGTNGYVTVVAAAASSTAATGTNAAFNLDGNSAQPNDAGLGSVVLMVVFNAVPLDDARSLNRLIDGPAGIMGEDAIGHDVLGRVKYDFTANPGAAYGDIYIYVANK